MGGDADPESQLAESLAEEDPFVNMHIPARGKRRSAGFEKVAARFNAAPQ